MHGAVGEIRTHTEQFLRLSPLPKLGYNGLGAQGGTRTRNNRALNAVRLPIAPPTQTWCRGWELNPQDPAFEAGMSASCITPACARPDSNRESAGFKSACYAIRHGHK